MPDKPRFKPTRALFIANLRRPLSAIHFQNYLKKIARDGGGYLVERAWLNRTRTHGIVVVDKEEGAEYIQRKLLASIYPPAMEDDLLKKEYKHREQQRYQEQLKLYHERLESLHPKDKLDLVPPTLPRELAVERLNLYVDYIPVKAISQWIWEEDRGPRNGKWKVNYKLENGGELIAVHTLLSGDFVPHFPQNRNRRDRDNRSRGRDRRDRDRSRYTPRDIRNRRGERDSYVPNYDRPDYRRRDRDRDEYRSSRDRSRSRSRSPM